MPQRTMRQDYLRHARLSDLMALLMCMFALASHIAAQDAIGDPLDRTRLPIGDYKVSDTPQTGYVYRCGSGADNGIGGAQVDGPWIKSDGTFDFTAKAIVDGQVEWPQHALTITLDGDTRRVESNDLPDHPTGVYPIASSDDAYQYDRNPNRISEQTLVYALPANPVVSDVANCLTPGAIGVLNSGTVFFDALDALQRDAVAHETQDGCQGHPEVTGVYHYHNLTDCITDEGTGHSALVGYALDGFGLYGVRGEDGEVLTDADLDECHGHAHQIEWDVQVVDMYHYHATYEYPYTLGCFRGTPVVSPQGFGQSSQGGQPGQAPPGGQNPPPPPGGQPGQPPGGQNPPPGGSPPPPGSGG